MKRHWRQLAWGLVCLGCLIGLGVMVHRDRRDISQLIPQRTAERWETREKPYAMASVFLSSAEAIPQASMGEFYLSVEKALTAGGVPSDTHPWCFGASYTADATLRQGSASCGVELTAVSGDFFQLHPLPLRCGYYLDKDAVMRDGIVLDRNAAWDLFYSDNVAGQFVELDGYSYQVAAVVDMEPGRFNDLATGKVRRAWVLSDSPALAENTQGFTCLEAVLPQPVDGFAASTLKSALGTALPEHVTVLDNSGRFSLRNRWNVRKNLTTRGIIDREAAYPYWENAARLTENHLAQRLIPEAILLLIPAISLLALLLWLNHRRTWGLHSLADAAENALERKRTRDWERHHPGRNDP